MYVKDMDMNAVYISYAVLWNLPWIINVRYAYAHTWNTLKVTAVFEPPSTFSISSE